MNDLDKFIIEHMPLEGWCSDTRALDMAHLVLDTKPSVIVEIGVFGGRSCIPMAIACRENNKGVVYGIDPWSLGANMEGKEENAIKDWWKNNAIHLNSIHQTFMDDIWKLHLERWMIPIRAGSEHVYQLFKDIDILSVDGNHSELTSVRDVSLYLPLVRTGGYVWFDDTDWSSTTTARDILECACTKIRSVGSCNLYQKKEKPDQ